MARAGHRWSMAAPAECGAEMTLERDAEVCTLPRVFEEEEEED
jgi:hypothetical protein